MMNYISKISDAGRLLRDGYVVYELDESNFFRLQDLVEELCSYIKSPQKTSDPLIKEWVEVLPKEMYTRYIDFLYRYIIDFVLSNAEFELNEDDFCKLNYLIQELCSYIISKKEISDPFVKEWIDVIPEVFFTDYIDFLKIDVTEFVFSHEDRLKKLSYTRFRELYKRKNT